MKVLVWDWPTRLFHWLLAICVIGAIVSVKIGGNAMNWHFRFGYCVLGLVLFRILWGFAGSRYARFASFPPSPMRALAYLRGKISDTLGHNPLGALSVYALLLLFGGQAVGGLFANDDIAFEGPLAKFVSSETVSLITRLHKLNEWVLYALVAVHLGAILYYRFVQKDDLVGPMITGTKPGAPEAAAPWSARLSILALVLAGAAAGAVWWVVSLGKSAQTF
ncbi:MAG TPA: cytochrome b/b6 domain-containing protein [Burkholderiaceae bacterium]|nr:cytochrome b/b6 domain-containing protein [Burkholderiaceae bacterium]